MFVFSNLATSLDGKIATASRAQFWLGTPTDRKQMQVLRKRCDVVVMGASTLRTHQHFCGVLKAPPQHQPANAILSTALEGISPKWPFFADPSRTRLLFLTQSERVSPRRLREFRKTSEIVALDPSTPKKPVARQIIEALETRGYRDLLVEGGGGLMWDFASENLIDEYNLTLTPKIIGGADSPTLVEGKGFDPEQILKLKLHRCRRVGDELYLVYRKQK